MVNHKVDNDLRVPRFRVPWVESLMRPLSINAPRQPSAGKYSGSRYRQPSGVTSWILTKLSLAMRV